MKRTICLVMFIAVLIAGISCNGDKDKKDWKSYNRDAMSLFQQGKYDEAIAASDKAIEKATEEFGEEHENVATAMINKANVHYAKEEVEEAKKLYIKATGIMAASLPPDSPRLAPPLNNLGFLYASEGEFEKAETSYNAALEIQKKAHGEDAKEVGFTLNNLAELYRQTGEMEKAEEHYERSLALYEKAYGKDDHSLKVVLQNMAGFYRQTGNEEKAEELEKRAQGLRTSAHHQHPVERPAGSEDAGDAGGTE